jgi:predicted negative regulator of RcsB-dependent stress response
MENAPIPIAEIEQGPSKFEEFLDKNQKKLVILAILIFLGVLAYVFMTGLEKKKAADAGALFMQASDEESFNKIITEHSSSPSAGTAAMAIAQLRTTDDDRTAALNHFIDTYPDHPGVPAKLLELALVQMNAGKNSDAENTLNKLISNDKSEYLIPRAKIALADILASENELEKAEKIYKEIKDSKHFSNVAAERLIYLKAKDPIVVDKKPAEPAPTTPTDPITPTPELIPTPSLNPQDNPE